MKRIAVPLLAAALAVLPSSAAAPRDAALAAALLRAAAAQPEASFLAVRDGKVVAARYAAGAGPAALHHVHSCAKSVVSLLFGIAHAGDLAGALDAPVVSSLPEYAALAGGPGSPRAAVTAAQLLSMTGGVAWDDTMRPAMDYDSARMAGARDWLAYWFAKPLARPPGTAFIYDSGGTQVLSALVGRKAGKRAELLAAERLFGPLGVASWRWDRAPDGQSTGGWGLYLTLPGMAAIGEMVARGGEYRGIRVAPAAWIEASGMKRSDPGEGFDYGYLWWLEEGAPGEPAMIARGGYFGHNAAIAAFRDSGLAIAAVGEGADIMGFVRAARAAR